MIYPETITLKTSEHSKNPFSAIGVSDTVWISFTTKRLRQIAYYVFYKGGDTLILNRYKNGDRDGGDKDV